MRRRVLPLALAVTAVGAVVLPSTAGAAPVATSTYVVTTTGPASAVLGLVEDLGGEVGFVYRNALQGFSVTLPVPSLPLLAALPGVASVEPDRVVRATGIQSPTPSYGLDRIDQRNLPLNSTYTTGPTGAGVTAYVVDTGIRLDHDEFVGRVRSGFDAVDGGTADDCNGHGTHVSGTVGGTRFGVAKAVSLVAVRVLDCDGSGATSGVIAGVDWVTGNHAAGQPAVANMSLGGGASTALDTAVQGAIADGVSFAVAAGNDGGFLGDLLGSSDACNSSPARVPGALTVAASDRTDTKASYSNKGACVDLFAPGTDITSAWFDGKASTNTISGTSMASPHVAGAAALYLSTVPSATPAQVAQRLVSTSTPGVVKSVPAGTANRLLFVS